MAAKTSLATRATGSVSAAIAAAAERISVVDKQLEALKDTFVYSNFPVFFFFTGSDVPQRQQSLFSIAMSTSQELR